MRNNVLGVLCVLVTGCGSEEVGRVDVETNDLGIASVVIERSTDADGRLLELRGFAETGDEIASARLRIGQVLVVDGDRRATYDGAQITLTSGRATFDDVAPDHAPHMIAAQVLAPALASFVRLHVVASEIADAAGITFSPGLAGGEAPYTTVACNAMWFGPNAQVPGTCAANSNASYVMPFTHVNKDTPNIFLRYFNVPAGNTNGACKQSDGVSGGCTGMGCYYGPCGVAAGGLVTSGSHPVVFFSTIDTMGYDNGDGDYYPEPYSNQYTETTYKACTCADCNANGDAVDGNGSTNCSNWWK